MKQLCLIACICCLVASLAHGSVSESYEDTVTSIRRSTDTPVRFSHATPHAPPPATQQEESPWLYGLQRGALNVLTCWMEVPRNLSYHFTDAPLNAVIIAPVFGASFAALRAVYSVGDLLTAGYLGHYSYAGMEDYVWHMPWLGPATARPHAPTPSPSPAD